MKRFLGLFLTLVYLLSSTGILVNFHYCHDELQQMAFYQDVDPCCCEGEELEPVGCCENTTVLLKGKEEAQVQANTADIELDFEQGLVAQEPQRLQLPSLFPTLSIHLLADNPPEKDRTILYHRLLLYA